MSDRLYLSCWVRGSEERNLLRHFETLLDLFPFSKLAKRGPVLRVFALEHAEPVTFEREYTAAAEPSQMISEAGEFFHADCCLEADTAWDLWQFDNEWKLAPANVTLMCLGPGFDNESGDHLRIEFGLDALFLPQKDLEGSARMAQSNLRSLLHLVNELERTLPVERRKLWSESGVNFAEVLTETLSRYEPN